MKKILIGFIVCLVSITPVVGQTMDVDVIEEQFGIFAEAVAGTLPMTAGIGLSWSDPYIGKFPHFGVGLSLGFAGIPQESFSAVFAAIPGAPDPLADLNLPAVIGIPFPAYSLDGRIGGFGLPFDIGIKIGFIPEKLGDESLLPEGMGLDYFMIGGDLRYALLEEKTLIPEIAIGAGYTHLRGSIGVPMGADVVVQNLDVGTETYYLELTQPNLAFDWQTDVIEAKVQIAKKILFIRPYLGAKASYAISKAGGGFKSALQISDGGAYHDITQEEIDAITAYYEALGQPAPDLSSTGFVIFEDASGWSYQAFGGVSFNLFFLHLDTQVMYNFLSKTIGGVVNFRIQI
ncbi:MAG: hypothetical protein KAU17_07890 [Spirochaetales bacterium]|nr:hypothetical protein [Spirochaetales bacterium]